MVRFGESGAQRLIFDLLDNPGGTLGETRKILDMLVPRDERIIAIRTRQEKYSMYSYDDPLVDLTKYEVIVLINVGTASAAEIIAGSLEDIFSTDVILL